MTNIKTKAIRYLGSSDAMKKYGAITFPAWPRMLLIAMEVAFCSGLLLSVPEIYVWIRGLAPKRPTT
jgi:hypothetical protein